MARFSLTVTSNLGGAGALALELSTVAAWPLGFDLVTLRDLYRMHTRVAVAPAPPVRPPRAAAPVLTALTTYADWARRTFAGRYGAVRAYALGCTGLFASEPGAVSLFAPALVALLQQRELSAALTEFAPRASRASTRPLVEAVSRAPLSALPSVTTLYLPPLDCDLPVLVAERYYANYGYGAPGEGYFEPQHTSFSAQELPQRSGHLKRGSMYWARLPPDQMRTQLLNVGTMGMPVEPFPCPEVAPQLLLGSAALEFERGAQLNTFKALQVAGALEQEVNSYLDLGEEESVDVTTLHASLQPYSAALASPLGAGTGAQMLRARPLIESAWTQPLTPLPSPQERTAAAVAPAAIATVGPEVDLSIKRPQELKLRTVDLEALFASSVVDSSGGYGWARGRSAGVGAKADGAVGLGLGPVQLMVPDSAMAALVPPARAHYIFARDQLYELLLYLTEPEHDALFIAGPTGCGKTSGVMEVAARLQWPVESVTLSQRSEVSDLIGCHTLVNGSLKFSYGPLTRAMLYGHILLLNEIDLMPPGELAALNDVLEGRNLTISANHGEVIVPHPFFRVVATANSKGMGDESGAYHGVKLQNQAFLDRWRFCEVGYPTQAQERLMLTRACPNLNPDFVDGILRFTQEVRSCYGGEEPNVQLLRRLEQAELRLLAHSVHDLQESAAALRSLLSAQGAQPSAAGADADDSVPAALNELDPFFDELVAHQSLQAQLNGAVDGLSANEAANQLFAQCEEQMSGFEQLQNHSSAQLQCEQARAQVAARVAPPEHRQVSALSAPFSSRALLRVARLYYLHEELSVQEALALGYASRLPPAEYEYLLRLSFDIFGYGSNFNALPHQVHDAAAYAATKARVLKYNLDFLQENLARIQQCQAQLMQTQQAQQQVQQQVQQQAPQQAAAAPAVPAVKKTKTRRSSRKGAA